MDAGTLGSALLPVLIGALPISLGMTMLVRPQLFNADKIWGARLLSENDATAIRLTGLLAVLVGVVLLGVGLLAVNG